MNYPCLRCILEYLEANKRLRLSFKFPTIEKIERSIPIHLELLDITSTTIRINDHRYATKRQIVNREEGVLEADIVLENQRSSEDCNYYYQVLSSYINNDTGNEEAFRTLKIFLEGVQFHHAMRWLGNHLFEGRPEITTRKLAIVYAQVLRLPANFKVKVTEILETRMDYLNAISELIVNPIVESITLAPYNRQPIHDHPLIQTAKKICIMPGILNENVLNIAHKNIEVQQSLPYGFFERLIGKWISDGKEIGSLFTFYSNYAYIVLDPLEQLEKMFNGRTVYKNVERAENITSQDLDLRQKVLMESHGPKEGRTILHCTCLPMSSTSELRISLSKSPRRENPIKTVLEVVPYYFSLLEELPILSQISGIKRLSKLDPVNLMNYPCLKCVVEYLEANKRFRLSARCPSIRKIERLIPLHLELLDITSNTIRINDYRYKTKRQKVKQGKGVCRGDIVLENDRSMEDYGYYYRVLCFSGDMDDDTDDEEDADEENGNHAWINVNMNFEVVKVFPEGMKFHYAMRWMGNFLFECRSEITTRKLEIVNAEVLRLPVDFKIKKVGILETRMDYLDGIFKFINPMVETIIFSPYNRQLIHDHALIQKAKKIIFKSGAITAGELNIKHKNIEYERALSEDLFKTLVCKWMNHGREIGFLFTFNSNNERAVLDSLKTFEMIFNGRTVYSNIEHTSNGNSQDLNSRQKALLKSHGLNEGRTILYCSCLPINSASEIQISLSRAHQGTYPIKIILEVVPFECWSTLTTRKFNHVEYKSKNDEILEELWPTLKSDPFEHKIQEEEFREAKCKLKKGKFIEGGVPILIPLLLIWVVSIFLIRCRLFSL